MIDDDDFDAFEELGNLDDGDWNSEEARKEMEAHNQRINKMPLMKKADEILHLTMAIVATIDEEKDVLEVRNAMTENAYTLMPKIAGAEGNDLYSLRMENAVLIKIHARELLAQTSLCKAENLAETKDLFLLREAIEEFRVLFVEWINSFDKNNDIPDEWGICYE
jgi:hypothetical protein